MLTLGPASDITIYIADSMAEISPELTTAYMRQLPGDEVARYNRFHFKKDRQLFFTARVLLRSVLSKALSCAFSQLKFESDYYGKPSLASHFQWPFNLSHSGQYAVLVVANSLKPQILNLGVDIEKMRSRVEVMNLAESVFSSAEIAQLASIESPSLQAEHFYRIWSLKEAYIKCVGKGMSMDLKRFSFYVDYLSNRLKISGVEQLEDFSFTQASIFSNYQLAVAINRAKGAPMGVMNVKMLDFSNPHSVSSVTIDLPNIVTFNTTTSRANDRNDKRQLLKTAVFDRPANATEFN